MRRTRDVRTSRCRRGNDREKDPREGTGPLCWFLVEKKPLGYKNGGERVGQG